MSTHMHGKLPYPRPVDWKERIANAKVRGYFTPTEHTMAQHWNSCAIGERFELQNLTPDAAGDVVEDYGIRGMTESLLNFGTEFYEMGVNLDNVEVAFDCYNKIVRRTQWLHR